MALPGWTMIAALGLVVANVLIMSIRWGYLLGGAGFQIGLWKLFSTVCVGRGANNILPARGGDSGSVDARAPRAGLRRGTLVRRAPARRRHPLRLDPLRALAIGQGGPMLLTGIAFSAGAALGVVLVALAARDPDGAERFAWKATRRLPPRWHTRFTRAAAHFVDGLGVSRAEPAGRDLRHLGGHVAGRRGHVLGGWRVRVRASTCPSARTSCSRASGTWRWPSRDRGRDRDVRLPDAAGREGHRRQPGQGDRVRADDAHALAVLPVTLMGAILVSPAFPRLLGRREPAQNLADDSGSREPLALAYSRARNGKVRSPARGHGERFGEPPAAAGSRRQVGLDRRPSSRAAATASLRSRSSAWRSASAPACSRAATTWPHVSGIVTRRSASSAPSTSSAGGSTARRGRGGRGCARERAGRRRARAGGWHAACRGGRARRSPA